MHIIRSARVLPLLLATLALVSPMSCSRSKRRAMTALCGHCCGVLNEAWDPS